MSRTDNWLTIKEALEMLELNAVPMNEPALRMEIVRGAVKSQKMFGSRVISKEEVSRLIAKRKDRKEQARR